MGGCAGIAATVFVAYHGAKVGTSVVGNYVASTLGRPALVRETSRRSVLSPRENWRRLRGTHQQPTEGLGGIVLAPAEVSQSAAVPYNHARVTCCGDGRV